MPSGEIRTEWPLAAHARNLFLGAPELFSFTYDWTRKRLLPRRRLPSLFQPSASGSCPLEFTVEELPNPNSRIKLNRETDPNGMNRLSVTWGVPSEFPEKLLKIYEIVAREARKGGLGSVTLSEREKEQMLERCHAQGGHHIGTVQGGRRHGFTGLGNPRTLCAGVIGLSDLRLRQPDIDHRCAGHAPCGPSDRSIRQQGWKAISTVCKNG
jgi:hypothetical protein